MGIFLKFFLEKKIRSTTREVENEYKKYFKEIARSTTSTYLNMLKKESTLYTERDGRIVHYLFRESPPKGMKPFWFTRMFCVVPAYFQRGYDFSVLYVNAEKYMRPYMNTYGDVDREILVRNFRFITGLIIHIIFEYVENTKTGMKVINKYFIGNSPLQWPGGKNRADKMINRVGDTVFFALGWITAYGFNEY